MAVRAEIGTEQANEREKPKAKNFVFKFNRFDEACIACFVPSCEFPIKDGWSDIEVDKSDQTMKKGGKIIPSKLTTSEFDTASYRAECDRGFSHFSSQPRMVVDVVSTDVGEKVFRLFQKSDSRAKLDKRYKEGVRIYIGACADHEFNLRQLQLATAMHGNVINRAILRKAIQAKHPLLFKIRM
jgi:hypothetical protein